MTAMTFTLTTSSTTETVVICFSEEIRCHLFQRPRKLPSNKLQADSIDFEKRRPPCWIRQFEFLKSDPRFVISDPENP